MVTDERTIEQDVEDMVQALRNTHYRGPYVLYFVDQETGELRSVSLDEDGNKIEGLLENQENRLSFVVSMSPSEHRFKNAVYILIMRNEYPSPTAINNLLGRDSRSRKMNNLNDRECRWRREICKEIGFILRGKNL